MVEYVKLWNVMEPDVGYHIDPRLTNMEFITLTPRFDTLNSKVDYLRVSKDVIGVWKMLWSSIIITDNHNPLTVECSNIDFGDSNTATAIRKDIQGSLFILIVSEVVYSVLW